MATGVSSPFSSTLEAENSECKIPFFGVSIKRNSLK